MSSAQIYPSEKLDLLFKHLQWWYIQKGLEKNIVPKKNIQTWVFFFSK